jgi:predicted dehydrogenase
MGSKNGLRIAVVGLGFGAEFVPIYLDHPDVQSVAICDGNTQRMQAVGARFGVNARFADLNDVIAAPDIDAVHLASAIPDHARHSIAVLKSGKHCACAVPMATTLADLRAIVAARRESGRTYMMMETAAYTRQCLHAQALLRAGEFGALQFLRGAHYQDMEGWPDYWAGMPPMWYATHAIGPLLALSGSRVVKVHCFGSGQMREELRKTYGNPFPIETAIFQLEKPGLCAEVTRSLFQCARPYMESFTVYGENACYEWQAENEDPVLYRMSPVTPGQRRTPSVERPAPPDRVDALPEALRRYVRPFVHGKDERNIPMHLGGGHHGSHPHLVHEFISSIVERRASKIDAVTAADWTAAGICAHESAMAGGREVIVPAFG